MNIKIENTELSRFVFKTMVFLVAILSSTSTMACNEVKLISGDKLLINNYDTFSHSPRPFDRSLKFTTEGDCKSLVFAIKPIHEDTRFRPTIAINSGSAELYDSTTAIQERDTLTITPSTLLILPLTISIHTDKTLAPGIKRKLLRIEIVALDSLGEEFYFEKALEITIDIAPKLTGGFSGTNVSNYTQRFNLDLGTLESGKQSSNIHFLINSNMGYDITLLSKNKGQLVLESNLAGVAKSSLGYSIVLDDLHLDLSSGSSLVQNIAMSNRESGNRHSLSVWPIGDPTKTRAGTYSDIVTIDIRQKF